MGDCSQAKAFSPPVWKDGDWRDLPKSVAKLVGVVARSGGSAAAGTLPASWLSLAAGPSSGGRKAAWAPAMATGGGTGAGVTDEGWASAAAAAAAAAAALPLPAEAGAEGMPGRAGPGPGAGPEEPAPEAAAGAGEAKGPPAPWGAGRR